MKKSGFPFQKFYYPYPDYKFPTEIFTDASLTTNHYGKNYPIYTDKTVDLFSESAGIEAMKKEQIADRFVNSFLLVAGKQELEEKRRNSICKTESGPQERVSNHDPAGAERGKCVGREKTTVPGGRKLYSRTEKNRSAETRKRFS